MALNPGDLQRSAVLVLSCSTLSSDQSLLRSPLAFSRCSAPPGTQYSRAVGHFAAQPSCCSPPRAALSSALCAWPLSHLTTPALALRNWVTPVLGCFVALPLWRSACLFNSTYMHAYVLVAVSFGVALCVFACLSVCFVVDFLLLSFSDTCLLSGNSGTRLFWPPSHSLVLCVFVCVHVCASTRPLPTGAVIAARPLRSSATPVLRHSAAPAPRCPTLGAVAAALDTRSGPTLDHSCSTASVLGRSPRPVPVLGGSGTRKLGARPPFGRKSSVFVHLHASVVVYCCCHRHCCYCEFFNPPLICFYPSRGDNV